MKIRVVSDLHLEFSPITLHNAPVVDLLILSGDICVADKIKKFVPFFDQCGQEYPDIVYVMGNHEHYHGEYDTTLQKLKAALGHIHNLHILENGEIRIDDWRIFGATLWTDVNKGCPITESELMRGMNDYRIIRVASEKYRKLWPTYTRARHEDTLRAFNDVLKEGAEKVIFVGHHAPSEASVHNDYIGNKYMNGGYVSDLSKFILDRPQIKLWTHGHVHNSFDYTIGETRVVANPRGYDEGRGPENMKFSPNHWIEV